MIGPDTTLSRYPPRVLDYSKLPKQEGDKTMYNAWGACIQDSCQYVPLKQRYDGYNKYQASIRAGTAALEGPLLAAAAGRAADWPAAAEAELIRALRRGVLLGNALLISANYGTSNEALVARFYVNEAYYALTVLAAARRAAAPPPAAADAWRLARDSWNSYLAVVNRAIPPKVGQRFEAVSAGL
jgi:hypothetical protein